MNNKQIQQIRDDKQKQQIVDDYCADNMRKLKKICGRNIRKVCGDSNLDEDDLYDVAVDVLISVVVRYDETKQCKFETFLKTSIQKKIDTYIRDTKYRYKRSNIFKDADGRLVHVPNVSIYKENEDDVNLVEKLDSGYRIEEELLKKNGDLHTEKWKKFLRRLSKKQQKIAIFLSDGYKPLEIREILHITEKEFSDHIAIIKEYENISVLF